jgi:hypothetical protein
MQMDCIKTPPELAPHMARHAHAALDRKRVRHGGWNSAFPCQIRAQLLAIGKQKRFMRNLRSLQMGSGITVHQNVYVAGIMTFAAVARTQKIAQYMMNGVVKRAPNVIPPLKTVQSPALQVKFRA